MADDPERRAAAQERLDRVKGQWMAAIVKRAGVAGDDEAAFYENVVKELVSYGHSLGKTPKEVLQLYEERAR